MGRPKGSKNFKTEESRILSKKIIRKKNYEKNKIKIRESRKLYEAEYRKNNKEKVAKAKRDSYLKNIEYYNNKSEEWIENNLEKYIKRRKNYFDDDKTKNKKLKRQYGITLKEYNLMFEKQQGCCLVCGKHQTELKRKLCIDHNHETLKIRGLLCSNCNTALGLVKENINILLNLIEYIKIDKNNGSEQ